MSRFPATTVAVQIAVVLFLFVTSIALALTEKPAEPGSNTALAARYHAVTAPLLAKESLPAIDGTVDKSEWTGAAQSLPFVDMTSGAASSDHSVYWVAYSDEALYFAFRFHRPGYADPPRSAGAADNVWGDDSLELFLRPTVGAKAEFNFVMNAAGTRAEGRRAGNTDKGWNAEWTGAARLIDGGYEGELRIPFASLGLSSPPAPGQAWEINAFNCRHTPTVELSSSTFVRLWGVEEDYDYLIFGGEQAPAVRPIQFGSINTEQVGAILELIGGNGGTRKVNVTAELYRPVSGETNYFRTFEEDANPLGSQAEGKDAVFVPADKVRQSTLNRYEQVKTWNETIEVPAQRTQRLNWTAEVPHGTYVLLYHATDANDGKLLAGGALPFRQLPAFTVEATPYLLSAQCLAIVADYRRVGSVDPEATIVAQLLEPGSDQALVEASVPVDLKTRRNEFRLPIEQSRLGKTYDLRTRVMVDGKVVSEHVQSQLALPPLPEWWGNDLGKVEKLGVPKPWTPIETTDRGFNVWGRVVELNEQLMPVQITHNEVPMTGEPKKPEAMLARAASLELSAGGQPAQLGKPQVTQQQPWLLQQRSAITGAGVEGTLTLDVEFDGLMKYTLELAPKADGAAIDHLVFELPIPRRLVTDYNHGYLGTLLERVKPYDYGKVPAEGLELPFTEKVWLGNDTVGFDWVAENDRWWSPMDSKTAVRVVLTDDEAALRIEMVAADQPRKFAEPVRFQWAILPTPAKPMNQELNHRLNLVQGGYGYDQNNFTIERDKLALLTRELVKAHVNAYNVWAYGYESPNNNASLWNPDFAQPSLNPGRPAYEQRMSLTRESVQIMKDNGMRWVTAYMLWGGPEAYPNLHGVYHQDMVKHPRQPTFGGYIFEPGPAFNDWYVWELNRTLREIGFNGIYQDSSAHREITANLYSGTGWHDDAGRLRGSYAVFPNRELHKRIWMMFHAEPVTDGLVYSHNTHLQAPVVESFVDVHHAGEGSALKLEHMIGKWYGYPVGNPTTWTRWNKPPYAETRMRSWRLSLLLDIDLKAHPSFVLPSSVAQQFQDMGRDKVFKGYDNESEVVWWLWNAWAEHPWDGDIWLPPWKSERVVTTGHADLLSAVHYNKGKSALVVVSSFVDQPVDTTVQLKLDELGFAPDTLSITDVVTGEAISHDKGTVKLNVLDNRWRMLSLKPAK